MYYLGVPLPSAGEPPFSTALSFCVEGSQLEEHLALCLLVEVTYVSGESRSAVLPGDDSKPEGRSLKSMRWFFCLNN